jgi:N6-adenosine-specific RNA methylase IME4
MQKYRTIVADPPWFLEMGKSRTMGERGGWNKAEYMGIAELQYPQMTVEQIAALEIPAEKDAHCYIWTINKYVEQTYQIMRAWGFKPSQLLTWGKAPMGLGLGLGGTFVNTSEFILFGRRGNLKAKQRIDSTWWNWKRGVHSQKPEAFQDMVEAVSHPPYLEMFARRYRLGWDVWGNEVSPHVEIPVRSLTTACTGLAGFSASPSESTLEVFTGQVGLSQPTANQ